MVIRRTGVREAKARLSRLLHDVQRGGEWIITDRGKPVARLTPVGDRDLPLDDRIRRMEATGLIEPATRAPGELPPPLPLKREGQAQEWLQEDRNA